MEGASFPTWEGCLHDARSWPSRRLAAVAFGCRHFCEHAPMSSRYDAKNDNERRKAWATLKWYPERLTDAYRALLLLDEPDFYHPVDAQRHLYDEKGFAK
jgi:hypothetical protein